MTDADEILALLRPPGEEWRAEAACKGMNPDFFYPERGEDLRAIKKVCHGCPVRAECLEWALESGEAFGVWGGLSERSRRVMRRDRRLADGTYQKQTRRPPPHGTDRGYRAHMRDGEKPCDGCRFAHTEANRGRVARREELRREKALRERAS